MTHEPHEPSVPDQERLEAEALTNTILSAFDLADSIETHVITPGSHEIERSVTPEMLNQDYLAALLPPEVLAQIDSDEVGMDITYQFTSQDARPSLELKFFIDKDSKLFYFATVQRRSGESSVEMNFSGNALINPSARDYEFEVSNEAVSQFIQDLIKIDNLVITDKGITMIDQELVLDPQHPPMARYIYEVLATRGLTSRDEIDYPMEFDGQTFHVRTSVEDGKTTTITIIEVLQNEITALGDEIKHFYSAIGARISRTKLSQAIEFFKPTEQGDEISLEGGSADLLLLRERIDYLSKRIREESL